MAATYREIMEERDLQTPRQKYYVGRRSFEVAKASALALADEFWGEDYDDRSGPPFPSGHTAPIVVKPHIIWHPQGMKGRAVIRVDYESHGVGFCRVYTRQYGRPFRILETAEGLVEGMEKDGRHEWYLLTGDNASSAPLMEVQLETTYARGSVPYATAQALQGKVNSANVVMGDFGTALAGKLRYDQMKTSRLGGGYIRVQHFMTYDYNYWTGNTTSGVGYWTVEDTGKVVTATATVTAGTVTAVQAIFTATMVGENIWFPISGERAKITAVTDSTHVTIDKNLSGITGLIVVEVGPRRPLKVFKKGARMGGDFTTQAGLTNVTPAYTAAGDYSTVTALAATTPFLATCLNHYLRFAESGNEYRIVDYTSTSVILVDGDASKEGAAVGFIIGPLIVGAPRASTADGAPVYASPSSTVTVDDYIFRAADVGHDLTFWSSGTPSSYTISAFTNPKVVVVTGDASGEADGDIVTISHHRTIYTTASFAGFGFDALTAW